jgi:hypothetical protein
MDRLTAQIRLELIQNDVKYAHLAYFAHKITRNSPRNLIWGRTELIDRPRGCLSSVFQLHVLWGASWNQLGVRRLEIWQFEATVAILTENEPSSAQK